MLKKNFLGIICKKLPKRHGQFGKRDKIYIYPKFDSKKMEIHT